MKANFALSLSFEGIGLRHRGSNGWQDLGRVPLDAPDLDDRLRGLHDAASDMVPTGVMSDVVLPDDQILYRHLPDVPDDRHAVAKALEGLTPYAVADLVFDWQRHPAKGVVVAAVARETLAEAEVFAQQHGFGPVAFTGDPADDKPFRGAPDFGPASATAVAIANTATAPESGADETSGGDPVVSADATSDALPPASTAAPDLPGAPLAAADADTDVNVDDRPADDESGVSVAAESAPATSPVPAFSTRRPAGDAADGQGSPGIDAPNDAAGSLVLTAVARRLGQIEVRGAVEDKISTATDAAETSTETTTDTQPAIAQAPVASAAATPDPADADKARAGSSPDATPSADPAGSAAKDRSATAPSGRPAVSAADRAFPIAVAIKPKQPGAARKPVGQSVKRVPPGVRAGHTVHGRKNGPPALSSARSAPVGGASRQLVAAGVSRIASTSDAAKAAGAGFVPRDSSLPGEAGIARLLPVSPVVVGLVIALAVALAAAVGLSRIVVGWLEPPANVPAISADAPMVAILPPIPADAALAPIESAPIESADVPVADAVEPGPIPDATELTAATEASDLTVPVADQNDPALIDSDLAALVSPPEEGPASTPDVVAPPAEVPEVQLPPDAADEPAAPATATGREDPDMARERGIVARSDPGIGLSLPGQLAMPAQTDASPVAPSQFVQGPGPAPVDLPAPPSATGAVPDTARIVLAALDTQVASQDLLLLVAPSASEAGREPQPAQPLPPPGTVFALDARGLVAASPDGALSPDGHLVTLGRPAVVPPERALVALPAPELAADPAELLRLAAIRPRERPAPPPVPAPDPAASQVEPQVAPVPSDLAVTEALAEALATPEVTAATPAGTAPVGPELPGLRPPPRPPSVTAAPEATPATADDATAPRIVGATRQAVATSLRPTTRPSGFDAIVAAAMVRVSPPPAATTTAAAAPSRAPAASDDDFDDGEPEVVATSRAPQIPSSANVARQATVSNAINLRQINLIGVYGTASDRRALIRLSNGRFVKVQVGDRVDGGQVAAIGEREVRYVKGGQNHVLSMPRG